MKRSILFLICSFSILYTQCAQNISASERELFEKMRAAVTKASLDKLVKEEEENKSQGRKFLFCQSPKELSVTPMTCKVKVEIRKGKPVLLITPQGDFSGLGHTVTAAPAEIVDKLAKDPAFTGMIGRCEESLSTSLEALHHAQALLTDSKYELFRCMAATFLGVSAEQLITLNPFLQENHPVTFAHMYESFDVEKGQPVVELFFQEIK